MTFSIIIASHGSAFWKGLAVSRALPSARQQDADEVIIRHEPRLSLHEVRNASALEASGDWLVFLDADDELAEGYVHEMQTAWYYWGDVPASRAITIETGYAMIEPMVLYRRGSRKDGPRFWDDIDIREGLSMVIGTAIPRKRFIEVGGFRDYGQYEDWDLFARLFAAGCLRVRCGAVYVAHARIDSRNRSKTREEKAYWHQRVGHDNWPDYYPSPSAEEDAARRLDGPVRKLVSA